MNLEAFVRERVWMLLSELFIDTELSAHDLRRLGQHLLGTGVAADQAEAILRSEVAPVCGRWMLYGATVGPWPAFDECDLKRRIERHIRSPWRRFQSVVAVFYWWRLSAVRRDWQLVRDEMNVKSAGAAHNGT
jgi:hypothetical protein